MINYKRWLSAKPVHDCGLEQTYIGIITLGSEAEYAKGSVFEYTDRRSTSEPERETKGKTNVLMR
jgi:hypothetical protein